tara:strand:- start:12187 stop:12828 length:642 start_codon:yes stop_codon:yes gene_type:complete
VDIYTTEEQQVEALKKWWAANGTSVVAGIVIGLAAIFGWRYWQDAQMAAKDQASGLYEQLHKLSEQDTVPDSFWSIGEQLENDYAGTGYHHLALLLMASESIRQGKLDQAAAQLKTVADNGVTEELKAVSRVRLARIYIEQEKYDEALGLVKGQVGEQFVALYAETEGDAYRLKGELALAKDAYQRAYDIEGEQNRWLKMKLDDVSSNQVSES